ncbi:MAG: TonB-dependent receptor [Candidatus Obscuribacterales bacterium]|nr:TonB-dependent receptor [Steroidobacteraceae bacterium]
MSRNNSLTCIVFGIFLSSQAVGADTPRNRRESLEAVVVTGDRQTQQTELTEETEKLLNIPGTFGDPLQAVYSLPGIVQTEEVGGAPAVRGSGPDDNSFLVDFLPASYVFHDFGFSIFNENLLRDFGVKKAGFGARYGRATGAIFDVTLREPRQQPWEAIVDASFLRVGGMVEGQLTDSQAVYVSVRESLLHLLLKARADSIGEEEDIYFDDGPRARDFQAKYSWAINDNNRLSVLGIGAQDQIGVTLGGVSDIALIDPASAGSAELKTQFVSTGINWLFDNGANRLQSAFGYLDESRDLYSGGGSEFRNTDVARLTAKSHYERALNDRHRLAFGGEYQRARYGYAVRIRYRSCTNFTPGCEVERGPLIEAQDAAVVNSTAAFIEDRWQISKVFALTLGVHNTRNDYLDESYVEPRVAAEWQLNKKWEVHGSWGKYHQLPRVDQFIPVFGNPLLVSPQATHYVLGVTERFENGWSWTSDVYYKEMQDLIVDINTSERYLNRATGTAYGAELMVNKNRDGEEQRGWYGWLSLSLSRTKRDNELTGTSAIFEYDTPVLANVVANYRFARKWDAGFKWTMRSGMPYTPVVGNVENPSFPGFYIPVYGELNSRRAAPYHRLDIRVEHSWENRVLSGSVYVDIINLYARKNGGAVQYKPVAGSATFELEEEESLPLLPSIGVKLVF